MLPINVVLLERDSEKAKVISFQHLFHVIAVAHDSILAHFWSLYNSKTENCYLNVDFENWLSTKCSQSRSFAHYKQFLTDASTFLLLYFAARNGNVELWHECLAYFGPRYGLCNKN